MSDEERVVRKLRLLADRVGRRLATFQQAAQAGDEAGIRRAGQHLAHALTELVETREGAAVLAAQGY